MTGVALAEPAVAALPAKGFLDPAAGAVLLEGTIGFLGAGEALEVVLEAPAVLLVVAVLAAVEAVGLLNGALLLVVDLVEDVVEEAPGVVRVVVVRVVVVGALEVAVGLEAVGPLLEVVVVRAVDDTGGLAVLAGEAVRLLVVAVDLTVLVVLLVGLGVGDALEAGRLPPGVGVDLAEELVAVAVRLVVVVLGAVVGLVDVVVGRVAPEVGLVVVLDAVGPVVGFACDFAAAADEGLDPAVVAGAGLVLGAVVVVLVDVVVGVDLDVVGLAAVVVLVVVGLAVDVVLDVVGALVAVVDLVV